ncbi:MAG TPA: hydrogenase maturation nickel metallochaperone HypA [Longimicrobium sp.]|nr:hydrogenase maturation nickel metallochaperone HypA [Longimicrobium sp.]
MHELPATEAMLALALNAAGGRRVLAIDLTVGEMGSIVDDSVQFYFDILSRGTPAEGAALRFRRIPGDGVCLDCGHRFGARPPLPEACPICAGSLLRVSGGHDFLIDSLEVDE